MADTPPAVRPGLVARFNETLARRATLIFGTMWAFYVFTIYSLLPIVDPKHQVQYLLWSNAVQMVALPLLMVGTNILGRDSEQRSLETHDAVMEEVTGVRELIADLHARQADTHEKVTAIHEQIQEADGGPC